MNEYVLLVLVFDILAFVFWISDGEEIMEELTSVEKEKATKMASMSFILVVVVINLLAWFWIHFY